MSSRAGPSSGKPAKGRRGSDGAREWRHRIGQASGDGRDDWPMNSKQSSASSALLS